MSAGRWGAWRFDNGRSSLNTTRPLIASGIGISPLKLPLRSGIFTSPDTIFDGLYGVFNDSLPDGWGRLMLDRTVEKHGVRRGQLSPLEGLAYVGHNGMGALSYEPDLSQYSGDDKHLALDRLARESAIVLAGEYEEVFEELLRLSGYSAGARPKIVAGQRRQDENRSRFLTTQTWLRAHWMIKFASSQDPRDIGAIEYAYSVMAKDTGVEMPETHLFRTKKRGDFGTKRFDRQGDRRNPHA